MDDTGGLTPGSRFDRMEASLSRIEDKLDRKVDRSELDAALHRIMLLESGDTPLGKVLLGQFSAMQTQLADLQLHGSQNAQAATKELAAIEFKVAQLEASGTASFAVASAARERMDRNTKLVALATGALSIFAVLVSVIHGLHFT